MAQASYADHQALKSLNEQHKINPRHAKWVEFLQSFSFISSNKQCVTNVVVNALSRRHYLLSILFVRVFNFQVMEEHCIDNDEMIKIMEKCSRGA